MNNMQRSDIQIRRPKVTELAALRRLFARAVREHFNYFPVRYQEEILREHSHWRLLLARLNRHRALYVVLASGQLSGYVLAGYGRGEGHIYWLFVSPDLRGGNLGVQLLQRALEQLRRDGARRVVLNTHDHEKYYLRQGFKTERQWQFHGVPITFMATDLGDKS